jgi:ATP-dependent DNA helicase DinG
MDELNFFPKEYLLVRNINADNYFVSNEKNNYNKYEFLYKARKKLESSNIIIINHSLLFSDINSKNTPLFKVENLVIDEAHSIEDSITESLRNKYSYKNLNDSFSLLEKIMKKNSINKSKLLKLKESLLSKLDILDNHSYEYLNNKVITNQKYKLILIQDDFYDENYTDILSKVELDFLDIIDSL